MRNGALLAISPLEGLAFAWTVGWTCFQTGRWEPHVERCIRELLRPGDTALDVGANLGYFTTVMAQCVGGHGKVWAFEPVPPTFDRLRLSVSLNGFTQVTPLAVALGDAEGTAEIAVDPRLAGSASLHGDPLAPSSQSHRIGVRRLDDLVADGTVGSPRLIKIDVEGHELAAVRGALRTIARAQPAIILEFSEPLARRAGWTLAELGEAIASCGDYRFFEIGDDGMREIHDLATYATDPGRYGADLLAAPAEEALRGADRGRATRSKA
jgi:FkbM family methyltransferase